VVQSSVSNDDEDNRKNPFQRWQSTYAEQQFYTGLQEADVVFYDGHSRNGGGPDFFAPRLTKAGTVDFSFYEKNTPGLSKVVRYLKLARHREGKPQLLGLFSCSSSDHFKKEILAANDKVGGQLGLISSTQLLYYMDAIKSLGKALDAVLTQKCEAAFQTSLREGSVSRSTSTGSELTGFFPKPNPKPEKVPDSNNGKKRSQAVPVPERETETKAELNTKAELDTVPEIEIQADENIEMKARADAETKDKITTNGPSGNRAELKLDGNSESKPDVKPDVKSDINPDINPDPKREERANEKSEIKSVEAEAEEGKKDLQIEPQKAEQNPVQDSVKNQ
jgi:hypothetical protein